MFEVVFIESDSIKRSIKKIELKCKRVKREPQITNEQNNEIV